MHTESAILFTEVAEFPLCSEEKCYKSVIALPSMCDLQDLRTCEFPEASVLKYSIPPTPTGCVWGGGGREGGLARHPVPVLG